MDPYVQAVTKIVNEQEAIIGPLAVEQARKVQGLTIDNDSHAVQIVGDQTTVVENLVRQYQTLFGQTSVEVCKHAVSGILQPNQLPDLLRQA